MANTYSGIHNNKDKEDTNIGPFVLRNYKNQNINYYCRFVKNLNPTKKKENFCFMFKYMV